MLLLLKRLLKFKNGDTFLKTQRFFGSHFNVCRHENVPSRKTIVNWVSLFRNTGTTQQKTGGSIITVHTPENIEMVREAVIRSPRRCSRKQALALQLSNTSLWKILRQDFTKFNLNSQTITNK